MLLEGVEVQLHVMLWMESSKMHEKHEALFFDPHPHPHPTPPQRADHFEVCKLGYKFFALSGPPAGAPPPPPPPPPGSPNVLAHAPVSVCKPPPPAAAAAQ